MKSAKNSSIPKPFISMTDMLVSLNAGLLVLGILSATDQFDEKEWRQLQQEALRVEQASVSLRDHAQALQRRHQALLEQNQRPSAAPAKENEAPQKASDKTIARN
jgi:hypothetical protein